MSVFFDTSHCFLALEVKILFQHFALAFKGFVFFFFPHVGNKTFVVLRDFSHNHSTIGSGAFRQTKSVILQVPANL